MSEAEGTPLKEDLQASRRIERFPIPLDSLKLMFEKPSRIVLVTPRRAAKRKEVETERSLPSPEFKQQLGSCSNSTTKSTDTKGGKKSFEKMSSANGQNVSFEAVTDSSEHPLGLSEASSTSSPPVLLDLQEAVSLKERMAMYQAAVSKKELSSSANAIEESETCTVPGGLASMKKQFEKADIASSHNTFTQYQYQQHTSVKEIRSSSEVTVKSSTQETKQTDHPTTAATQCATFESEKVSLHEQSAHETNMTSSILQEFDGTDANAIVDGEIPKVSTHILKEQFEKAAKEKGLQSDGEISSLGKHIKMRTDYQEFEWPPVTSTATGLAGRIHETSTTRKAECASAAAYASSTNVGSMEEFPPPPADLLQTAFDIADFSQSPEPSSSPERHTIPRDVYSKQRNLYELKRLYKHIHPEVRKHLEKDYFSEVSGIISDQADVGESISGDVQQARYVFENSSHSPQKCPSPEREYLEWDEILKGEVQSMRWVFENQPLDTIKDESPDQSHIKCCPEQELIAGGDVKYTTWMFETQPMDALGAGTSNSLENVDKVPELARGDVRTATWLFETQSLDSMNKMYTENTSDEAFPKDITSGDVKNVKYLFETQHHDALKQLYSVDEVNLLQLRSECEEIKGDVKRTVKLFETEPMYVLRDSSGQVLEIKTVRREDLEKGDVRTARWMFETQPMDMINHDSSQVKVVRGISMEENVKGGVSKAKWVFETQSLDTIKEEDEMHVVQKETIEGTDVLHKRWLFETQQVGNLKDTNMENVQAEEIIGGDVSTTKYLFETLPMDALKDTLEVGKLQKVITTEEERGDVRHQRWRFETKPLEEIRDENKEIVKTVALEEIGKGDISSCMQVFETIDLTKSDHLCKIQVEGVPKGAVELNKTLFESTPLYAIEDSVGKYHEVKTIRQEEVLRGDVRTCKWMFETKPIDQFDESIQNFQIIKGISAEKIQSGDVKTGKWLFETQPLDSIKYFSNVEEDDTQKEHTSDIVKGDVKMCKWLFETQPMEALYDKDETCTDGKDIHKGDVKTCTWLFESQPLDAIREDLETTIKLRTVDQEDIQGRDVQMACFLFETKKLENIQEGEIKDFKRVVEMDIQSGDVSTMKYIFENQSLDSISSSKDEVLKKITVQDDDIQKGNVLNCRWRFENQAIDDFKEDHECSKSTHAVADVTGGNVKKGCFIFETFSLDQIKDIDSESRSLKTISEEEITKGDVRSYTMLFETQPFYAIQDKEGYYHEVTTVKKEEVMHGDVCGTRWLFETKPLDSINESDEVYVIKAVTQEDIQKGDVNSVRWRFETQSLDTISEDVKVNVRTIESIQGGDVKASKELFESESLDNSQCVRTVSVSEIQQGNVRTSTWLFETHTIDEIRGQESEYENIKKVTMEDVQKGDVQQAVWLFENQPLGSLKEKDENSMQISKEEIPQADVKTTTWLFETTPFHEFNDTSIEKHEIMGKSIKETLKELYSHNVVDSHGIIIETDEIGDVRMAKYQLMNTESPEIQKEEIIRGDLKNIMMNLLSKRGSTEKAVSINEEEKGNVSLAKYNLLNRPNEINVQKEEIVRGDIQQATQNLFSDHNSVKQGILIQENERGDIKMTVYSLLKQSDDSDILREEVVAGDVKRTIHSLQYSAMSNESSKRVMIDESERGNVQFFTTCIESGALDYLKLLQTGSHGTLTPENEEEEEEEIIGGDVEGTKLRLKKHQTQIERTVNEADIIPGDVNSTVKIFMTEPQNIAHDIYKEEVIKGDLKATLNSLNQAIHQTTTVVEKENIIKADLPATLKSLKESTNQLRETEKPDVVPGNIQGAIESLEKAANTKTECIKDEVLHADIEATLKSLKEAQQSFKDVSKEDVVKGDVQTTVQNLLEAASEKKPAQHQVSVSGDIKSTIQTLFEPSQHTGQRRASMEGNVQSTIKTLLESSEETHMQKEIIPKSDIQSTMKIFSARESRNKNTSGNEKHLKGSRNQKHSITEKVDVLPDKAVSRSDAKRETGYQIDQDMNSHSTISSSVKNDMKTYVFETHTTSKKDSKSNDTAEKHSLEEQHFDDNVMKGHKDTVLFDLQKHKEARATENTSKSMASSKSKPKQPINIEHGSVVQVTDRTQKQMSKQETINAQHSQEVIQRSKVIIQPVQSFVSEKLDNNLRNNQEVQVIQGVQNGLNAMEINQKSNVTHQNKKSTINVTRKSKVKTTKEDSHATSKYPVKPTKSQMENPTSPPLPISSSMSPSAVELPLPPPPPLIVTSDRQTYSPLPPPPPPVFRTKAEYDNFPPPPPPVDDASNCELVVSPTPPPQIPSTVLQKSYPSHENSLLSSVQSQIKERKQVSKPNLVPHSKKVTNSELTKQLENKQHPEVLSAPESHVSIQYVDSGHFKASHESETVTGQFNAMCSMQKQDVIHTQTEEEQVTKDEELVRQLNNSLQETPPIKRNGFLPTIKPPPSPTLTSPTKSKPYARKFKTPLMIAEEKYRQQRDELDKEKAKSSCHVSSSVVNETQTIQVKSELEHEASSYVTPIQNYSASLQGSGLSATSQNTSSDLEIDVTSQTGEHQVNTEQQQHIHSEHQQHMHREHQQHVHREQQQNIHSSTERHIKQDNVSHFKQENLACERELTHPESNLHQKEKQSLNKEQRNTVASPTFKVKVVKLPTKDHKMQNVKQSTEMHTQQNESIIQSTEKEQCVKKQTEEKTTTMFQEKRVVEGYHHVNEKELMKNKPIKHKDISQEARQDSSHFKKNISSEMETGKIQVHHENISLLQDIGQKKGAVREKGHTIQSRQEQQLDKSTNKVVKQKDVNVTHESQIQTLNQVQPCIPESKLQQTKVPQKDNNVMQKRETEKYTREGSLVKRIDTKTVITQGVSQDSQIKTIQPIERSSFEGKVQQTKLPQFQKNRLEKSIREKNIKDDGSLPKTINIKQDVNQNISHDTQIHTLQQMKQRIPDYNEESTKLPQQQKYLQENSTREKSITQAGTDHKATDKKHKIQIKPSFSPTKTQLVEARGSIEILEYLRKREEIQHVLSKVKELESEPEKLDTATFQTFINIIPGWLINEEVRTNLDNVATENNKEKMKNTIMFIKDRAVETYSSCETAMHNAVTATSAKSKNESNIHHEASKKISHICTTSNKRSIQKKYETMDEKEVCHEMRLLSSEIGSKDCRISSPSLKTRSPSPTYITIESIARRTESPHKDLPCSSPSQRETVTAPEPPRRSATPTQRVTRSSPSPPRSRSEQLAKLKDTTAKLSQGATPPRSVTPIPIVEKKSEIIQSPATLRRQIKVEMQHALEASPTIDTITASESAVSTGTVKDIQKMYEEARKGEQKRTYMRKDPIEIPERLDPDANSIDCASSTQKTEVHKVDMSGLLHKFESTDKQVYVRNEPAVSVERIRSENGDALEKKADLAESMPPFDIRSARSVFETRNQNNTIKNEKHKVNREDFGLTALDQEQRKESSRGFPCRQLRDPKEEVHFKQTSILKKRNEREPSSEALLLGERFSEVNATPASGSFDNVRPAFEFRHAPPTYEDVISGHSLDISAADSPEELLRNFQKTWQESERVFKSLGYTVSDTSETEMRSSFRQQESAFITENSTTGAGNMYSLSKDSLSNGMPGGRQADLP